MAEARQTAESAALQEPRTKTQAINAYEQTAAIRGSSLKAGSGRRCLSVKTIWPHV